MLLERKQEKVTARRLLPNMRSGRRQRGKRVARTSTPIDQRGEKKLKETSQGGPIARTEEEKANANSLYTEIYHNENPFILMFLTEAAKRCKSCQLDFCHRKKVIPFDIIFSHKERWMFPVNGDWSNCRPSRQGTVRCYHAAKKCLTSRFPYFSINYVEIPGDVKDSLRDAHKKYLTSEFGLTLE